MAIEKNCIRVSRFDQELSMNSRESISSDDDDDLRRQVSAIESDDQDDDDEFDDADSGAGSDDFDLFELGEKGAEFCQIGNTACSVPVELYDLPGLEDVLSLDVWNNVLTEEDKFSLTKYLPDLDQHTFMRTLKELFEGVNFHFGSPINKLFQMLKGGECEPRVAIYRDCLNIFQKRRHYHFLRKHQNSMVSNLCQIRDAWLNYRGYSIEEKLRVLHIMRTQKSLMHDKMEDDLGSDSMEKDEADDRLWGNNGKTVLKSGRKSGYAVGRNLELPSRMPSVGSGVVRYGKHNPKGILKLSGSKTPPLYGMDVNSKHIRSNVPVSWQNKAAGSDPGMPLRLRDQMRFYDGNEGDDEDARYETMIQQDGIVVGSRGMTKSGIAKAGNFSRRGEQANDSLMGLPFSSNGDLNQYGRYRELDSIQLKAFSGLEPTIRNSCAFPQTSKYYENLQQLAAGDKLKYLKGQSSQPKLKDNGMDLSGYDEPLWRIRNQGRVSAADSSFRSDASNVRSKKWKIGRESPDVNLKACRASTRLIPNGGPDKAMKPNRRYHRSEETESESSEQSEEMDEDDMNPLMKRKSTFDRSDMEVSPLSLLNSSLDTKHHRFLNKEMQEDELQYGVTNFSGKLGGFTDLGNFPGYVSKGKKGKVMKGIPMHSSGSRFIEEGTSFGYGKLKDEAGKKQNSRSGKSTQLKVDPDNRHASSMKYYTNDKKQKTEISNHYMGGEEDEMLDMQVFADERRVGRLGKRAQRSGLNAHDRHEKLDASMLGGNSVTKKRKAKDEEIDINRDEDEMVMADLQQINDQVSSKKKGKRKLDIDTASSIMETSDTLLTETGTFNVELETKPQKKPYVPITPTVHTGFSFSVVHLLSAIRLALITPPAEDSLEVHQSMEQNENCKGGGTNGSLSTENADTTKTEITVKVNMPSLTIQEIVDRVRSNPGDPCILEMQEPLQDIVRGVLKIFSSRTAPLGAKGWKALVAYEKSRKSWYWVGPVSNTPADQDNTEEVTSPEYWGIPQKMLVKLVDSFANWFKSGQETLQQIGSLPAPPISLMQCNLDEKERFRDLRAQKSLNTISSSSQEVRAYFQKEEFLRYSIPDRAFSYTAADGKKSIVAPLRRCGGKPTSKPRDHFMLKKDRPPHVTILCLVRDAAARLPGSIGTRADVCTLIRDSQYIVEDVSDNQVNQIVSGALDRLHYERDPCVQFDADRKLWVYLHRDREEEDFEDDGTSSTKKWKRQKKDPAEQSELGAVTVAVPGTVDQPGAEMGSDLNNDPPGIGADKKTDVADNNIGENVEESVVMGDGCQKDGGIVHQGDPVTWDNQLGVGSNEEHNLTCLENSRNEDFDDETLGEKPVGLLSASL